ncbi:hypothetical protein BH11MYX4_BH11MYX4_52550 [soil metagenome]
MRVLVFLSFAGMLAGLAIWAIGVHLARWPYVTTGAGMTYVGILVLAPAAIVLPLSAVLDRGLMFATRPRVPLAPGGEFDASAAATKKISRRGMIRAGAASLPALAAATGASGFGSAEAGPRMPTGTRRY